MMDDTRLMNFRFLFLILMISCLQHATLTKKTSSGFAKPNANLRQTGSNGGRDIRPWCQYGVKCYRKNPVHFQEFRHPGRDKHNSDSEED
jgi:hypothetical protein